MSSQLNVPSNDFNDSRMPSASQHPQPHEADTAGNKHLAALTAHGIRVRDFAYQNTLPPVTRVPRVSVQVQPRSRMLRRTRDMMQDRYNEGVVSDEEDPTIPPTFYIDSNGTGTSGYTRYRKKGAALERTLTEPADSDPSPIGLNPRGRVLLNPSARRPTSPPPSHTGPSIPTTPQRGPRTSPKRALSPITIYQQSQPSANDDSQETEEWIDTPLVTPNGSLQWPVKDTSAVPASQLESVLPQLPDVQENVTLSQLGFSPERSQQPSAAVAPSPATNTSADSPSRPRHSQLPPPTMFRPRSQAPSTTMSRPPSVSPPRRSTRPGLPPAPSQETRAPRYELRQRPPSAKSSAPRTPSRTRASSQAASRAKDSSKAEPPSKRRKITPPPAGRSRRANGAVKEII